MICYKKLSAVILFGMLFFSSCKERNDHIINLPRGVKSPPGMVWVPGGTFTQGARENDNMAKFDEKPAHSVQVDGFFIDITEVTNTQFREFVAATGYITTAEKPVEWEELKRSLPINTPKPPDSLLVPGSLIFKEVTQLENFANYGQWWAWQPGANWKQPMGPGSDVDGKDNYPVVHISFQDATAYCDWAGRRLATEAEWELAAMGTIANAVYAGGNDKGKLNTTANTWQGSFPVRNANEDGYHLIAPVMSFSPNSLGVYDMAGNVWEYTADWYSTTYYQRLFDTGKTAVNPKGADAPHNLANPYEKEKIIKGGSFLCSESYCSGYRTSARMGMAMGSSAAHLGFRTVVDTQMLKNKN